MRRCLFALMGLVMLVFIGVTVAATPKHLAHATARQVGYARITGYPTTGLTYSGTYTTIGRTAGCSWELNIGTTLIIDGDPYICEDRGMLGTYLGTLASPHWVDLYAGPNCVIGNCWVTSRYGDYQWIDVLDNE